MELIKDTVNLCETITKGTTQAMTDGDVNVPDTKPDVLKILQVDAEVYITDKYIDNGKLTVSGRVDYKVLYVPDKENEIIKSILTSMDFRQSIDAANAGADSIPITELKVDRVEFTTVNSRKIRLRAIIHIDYEICRTVSTDICTGIEGEGAEIQSSMRCFENVVDISSHKFTVKEMLEVPPGQSSIGEILKTDVKISDTEHKTVTGKIIVKGNAGICILYTDDENEIKFIEAEVPFTEVLDAENVREDTICEIDYSVIGVMCEAERDNDGDLRITELDIDINADVKGTEPLNMELMQDCFVPYSETEQQTETITVTETAARPSAQNTIRENIEFPSNVPGVSGVYNVMTNAVITKTELQNKRLICEGRIEAYVLYLTDTAENPIYSIKKDIPFSYMIDCENAAGDEETEIKAEVRHASYNLNSAGALELRCLLSLEGKLLKRSRISNIISVVENPRTSRRGIVICFANSSDSLWDIAKHYAVPQQKIAKYNNLEDGKIHPGAKLFIPA